MQFQWRWLPLSVAAAFFALHLSTRVTAEDVIYERVLDLRVQADLFDSADGLFRVFPEELDFDVNHDGISDLRFRHSLMPRAERVSPEAMRLLQFAEVGTRDNLEIVRAFRRIAVNAANDGVNDDDQLRHLQARIKNGLDTMDRIANEEFLGQPVLDGSFGRRAISLTDPYVEPLSVSDDTEAGTYAIEVEQAAERAFVEADLQTTLLSNPESLVVNGVSIELPPGMTQAQVVDRINDFSRFTHVYADTSDSGSTRIYTRDFGTNARLCVITNMVSAFDTSGFGTTE